MTRIYLSPPDVGAEERALLLDALDSGWIAPLGPHVDGFEKEVADYVGVPHAAALSSGTAALHLSLILLVIGPDHDVVVPTLTFVATPNAVTYTGARPVFVDSDAATWTMDPDLLAAELASRGPGDRPVGAVIAVDIYGQCADYDRIQAVCDQYGVPLVEDAAEALGATYRGRPAGSFGDLGVFSFNGNKLITTAGGGMLVGRDGDQIERARRLASQSREVAPHYEHREIGFNYRLSNLLAAIGRGQLRRIGAMRDGREHTNRRYVEAFGDVPGIDFMPIADYGRSSYWLSVITIDPEVFGSSRDEVREALEERDIEVRPAWKPMHLQPLYADAPCRGGAVAERVWTTGLCLPSGNGLSEADIDRVIRSVLACRR